MAKARVGIGNRQNKSMPKPTKPAKKGKAESSSLFEDLADKSRSFPIVLIGFLVLIGWNILAAMAPVEADPYRFRPLQGENNAVLVMISEPKCSFCDAWNAEIGPEYAGSPEGRFAPLVKRLETDDDVAVIGRFRKAPTFVLIERGQIVGRFEGYRSQISFWKQLRGLLEKTRFGKT